MDAPNYADETKQTQNKVVFIIADIVKEKGGALPEQIPAQSKNY